MDIDQFQSWVDHPVTQEVRNHLQETLDEVSKHWSELDPRDESQEEVYRLFLTAKVSQDLLSVVLELFSYQGFESFEEESDAG